MATVYYFESKLQFFFLKIQIFKSDESLYLEPNPNEGEWSEWSEETCSASCGPGTQKRKRTCEGKRRRRSAVDLPQISRVRRFFIPGIHLPPAPQNPVKPTCEGKSEDILACNLKKCPGKNLVYYTGVPLRNQKRN